MVARMARQATPAWEAIWGLAPPIGHKLEGPGIHLEVTESICPNSLGIAYAGFRAPNKYSLVYSTLPWKSPRRRKGPPARHRVGALGPRFEIIYGDFAPPLRYRLAD